MADDKTVKEPVAEEPVEAPKEETPKEEPVVEEKPVEEPTQPAPEPVEEKAEEAPKAEPETTPEPVEEKADSPETEEEAVSTESPAEEKPAKEEKVDKPKTDKKPGKEDKAPKEEKKEAKEEKPALPPVDKPKAEPKPKVVGIPPDKLLLFDKYDLSEVVVTDAGLARYINLDPVMVPHTGARHANRPFAKSKMNIVERLVNNMMRTEDYTGKKTKTYRVVMEAFNIIESKTKKNPVQVFINALENTTPREEVTRLRYGGVSVPKAVDISSSRRLDIALRNICKGAVKTTYKNTKPIEICLANEIIMAAKGDMNSAAISKKEEVERIAASAR